MTRHSELSQLISTCQRLIASGNWQALVQLVHSNLSEGPDHTTYNSDSAFTELTSERRQLIELIQIQQQVLVNYRYQLRQSSQIFN